MRQDAPPLPSEYGNLSASGLGFDGLADKSTSEIADLYHRTMDTLAKYKVRLEEKSGITPGEAGGKPAFDPNSEAGKAELELLDQSLRPIAKVFESFEVDYSQKIDIRL